MCTVIIGCQDKDHLLIEAISRTHPNCNDYWDGNWISCKVCINSGSFNAEIKNDICLRADEFKSFLEGIELLYESLKGVAKYSSTEGWLDLEISGDGKGHMCAKGYVLDKHHDGNKLEFCMNFDQTSIPCTINGLKGLLDKYPVLGK